MSRGTCPDDLDDLLVDARRGTLSAGASRTLNEHLAACATCRLVNTIGRSVGPLPPVDDEDEAMALRLLAGAPRPAAKRAHRRAPTRLVAPWRWPRWAAAAIIVVVAGVSSAAIWTAHDRAIRSEVASTATLNDALPRAKHAPAVPAALPVLPGPSVPSVAPSVATSVAPSPASSAAPSRVAMARPAAPPPPAVRATAPPPMVAAPAPEQLLRDANEARRARRTDDAVRAYRALQSAFPSSKEAVLSHLSLGNLELERGAFVDALAQFDAYLSSGGAELGEEALLGKAGALAALGRADEERAAWQTLQARYPRSEYLWRARQRLEALDRGGAP